MSAALCRQDLVCGPVGMREETWRPDLVSSPFSEVCSEMLLSVVLLWEVLRAEGSLIALLDRFRKRKRCCLPFDEEGGICKPRNPVLLTSSVVLSRIVGGVWDK